MIVRILLAVSAIAQSCSYLDADNVCGPEFEGFPLVNISADNFRDQIELMVLNLGEVEKQLSVGGKCNAGPGLREGIDKMRYQVSLFCALSINRALDGGCESKSRNENKKDVQICAKECSIGRNSFVSIISNPEICPSGNQFSISAAERTTTCERAKNLNGDCVLSKLEQQSCGFINEERAKISCATDFFKDDECCKKMFSSGSSFYLVAVMILVCIIVFVIAGYGFYRYRHPKRQAPPKHVNFAEDPVEPSPAIKHAPGHFSRNPTKTSRVGAPMAPDNNRRSHLNSAAASTEITSSSIIDQYSTPNVAKENEVVFPLDSPIPIQATYSSKARMQNRHSVRGDDPISVINATLERVKKIERKPVNSNKVPSPSISPFNISDFSGNSVKVEVIHSYDSKLPDELSLQKGQIISMIKVFDDGWGLGVDFSNNKHGAFPLVCVQILDDIDSVLTTENSKSSIEIAPIGRRLSSMVVHDIVRSAARPKVPFSLYIDQLDNISEYGDQSTVVSEK